MGDITTPPTLDDSLPGFVAGLGNTINSASGCVQALTNLRPMVLLFGVVIVVAIICCFPGLLKLFKKFISWLLHLPGKFFKWIIRKIKDKLKKRKKKGKKE